MEKNQPLVSIIVPCYKQAGFMAETLDSVISQTYTNWECIIVNDGSPDNTEEVAHIYLAKDPRFLYQKQQNMGLSEARNNGIRRSHGTYILPLDSDDIIADTYIEKAVAVFNEQPSVKLVYCKAKMFGKVNSDWGLPDYKYTNLLWSNQIFCTAMYRRCDYDKTIGYNPNMKGGLEDWDFWLSLLKPEDKVHRINEVLFFYRTKEISMSTQVGLINQKLMRQIYFNHVDVYAPYIQDIVYFMNKFVLMDGIKQQAVYEKEIEIRSSIAYRLGKAILKPFMWLKK
jgi:glycosyltransferase involved in cell wall biosynthesis